MRAWITLLMFAALNGACQKSGAEAGVRDADTMPEVSDASDDVDGDAETQASANYVPKLNESLAVSLIFEEGEDEVFATEFVAHGAAHWLISTESGGFKQLEADGGTLSLSPRAAGFPIFEPVSIPAGEADEVWAIVNNTSNDYDLQRILPQVGSRIPFEGGLLRESDCRRMIAIPSADGSTRGFVVCREGTDNNRFYTFPFRSDADSIGLDPVRDFDNSEINRGQSVGEIVLAAGDIDKNGTTDLLILSDSFSIPPYLMRPVNWDGALMLRCPPDGSGCSAGQEYKVIHLADVFGQGGYMGVSQFRLDPDAFPDLEHSAESVLIFADVGSHHVLWCENLGCRPIDSLQRGMPIADTGPDDQYLDRGGAPCRDRGEVWPTHWGMRTLYANEQACAEDECVPDMVPDMMLTASEFGAVFRDVPGLTNGVALQTGDDVNYLAVTNGPSCGPSCGFTTNYRDPQSGDWSASTYCNVPVHERCGARCVPGREFSDCIGRCSEAYVGQFLARAVDTADIVPDDDGMTELIYSSELGGLRVEQVRGSHPICTLVIEARYGFSAGGANIGVEQAFPDGDVYGRRGWDLTLAGGGGGMATTRALTAVAGSGRVRFPSGYIAPYECEPGQAVVVAEPAWIDIRNAEIVLRMSHELGDAAAVEIVIVSNPYSSDSKRFSLDCALSDESVFTCSFAGLLEKGTSFQLGYVPAGADYARWIETVLQAP